MTYYIDTSEYAKHDNNWKPVRFRHCVSATVKSTKEQDFGHAPEAATAGKPAGRRSSRFGHTSVKDQVGRPS